MHIHFLVKAFTKDFPLHQGVVRIAMSRSFQTEIFGVFEAYMDIIESSRLFGKCPLTIDRDGSFLQVDVRLGTFRAFWCRIVFTIIFSSIPGGIIIASHLINVTNVLPKPEINVPIITGWSYTIVFCFGCTIISLFVPVIANWRLGVILQEHLYKLLVRLDYCKFVHLSA